ncbi:YnbE family lipoprotein [Azospirillum sp. SYSU D00513]|uniref:YnbE family lipoprotein n=1 Tax=Azospirillum sp. SYSU D00513 TaxID=2812561 RepID=UPI001A95E314|nr:YnbE family lipoprotein [Azospirillum sp. SYSU D00513]
MTIIRIIPLAAGLALAGACAPTVRIEPPERPIEINLNIKIEQEVRVKVERDLEDAIVNDPALFGVPAAPPAGKAPK